jgi:hypothetical protein
VLLRSEYEDSCRIYAMCVRYSGVQHKLCCVFMFCLSSSCVPTVAVSQDCPFLIAPSVFSNVYFCPVACVPGFASGSGLSILDCPFGFL